MRTSFSTIFALSALFASSMAHPTFLEERQFPVCLGAGSPLCCDVDVLGVADLNCDTPPAAFATVQEFNDVCAGVGKMDMCCILPILDQGIICSEPTGL
ncbi:hypothetical protein ONS95_006531 [Cadophora gregata]|uniref:uncharacterized protein n=1 Tax=Cadophora gregata TaxID=51156 RepID=UPI0026DA72BE|nr:uncharacterized protein ONS95_006531 [Cadophora gregata]KAK0101356.1 hypothetical protein ONS95_006531 [Cadophora gregata]KAK0106634.1 hypothetical protein ONS96_004255 [Cadophora gregata f. sp. sojae]